MTNYTKRPIALLRMALLRIVIRRTARTPMRLYKARGTSSASACPRDVTYLHHLAKAAGHPITLLWLPGQCGVPGKHKSDGRSCFEGTIQMRNGEISFAGHDVSAMIKTLVLRKRWSHLGFRPGQPDVLLHLIPN